MQEYGLMALWTRGDWMIRATAVVLLMMSVISWTVILVKTFEAVRTHQEKKRAIAAFDAADNPLDQALAPVHSCWERLRLIVHKVSRHKADAVRESWFTETVNLQIEREVTMYQRNAWGMADPSYLDVQTPATLGYWRYAVRSRITQKFPRHKLADDGTRYGPGQAVVTPSVIRAELNALHGELEGKGLLEHLETFKEGLIVERNKDDRNRLDVLAPPDLVNQFRVFAMQTRFVL